jgi:hypothetical protein
MPLNSQQLDALSALEWLLDPDNRRSGRTLAIAVALVRVAGRHPGQWIEVVDHHGRRESRDYLLRTIDLLLRNALGQDYRLRASGSDPAIMANRFIPSDWVPSEEVLNPSERRAAPEAVPTPFERSLERMGPRERALAMSVTGDAWDASEDQADALVLAQASLRNGGLAPNSRLNLGVTALDPTRLLERAGRLRDGLPRIPVTPEIAEQFKKPVEEPSLSQWDRLLADEDPL